MSGCEQPRETRPLSSLGLTCQLQNMMPPPALASLTFDPKLPGGARVECRSPRAVLLPIHGRSPDAQHRRSSVPDEVSPSPGQPIGSLLCYARRLPLGRTHCRQSFREPRLVVNKSLVEASTAPGWGWSPWGPGTPSPTSAWPSGLQGLTWTLPTKDLGWKHWQISPSGFVRSSSI